MSSFLLVNLRNIPDLQKNRLPIFIFVLNTQQTFTCSKSTLETKMRDI